MHRKTRLCLNAYLKHIADLNEVDDATQQFNVEPRIQQKLETRIQESSDFLKRINIIGVREQEGEKLGLGIGSPIASTTDTNKQDRQTFDPSDLDNHRYRAEQTNFDTHITYAKLDAWAEFDDFQTRIRGEIIKRQALDRIMIGFNGTHRAATSDRKTNPLLQDINIGWLQQYRNQAPQRVLSKGNKGGSIWIGPGGDYATLDAVVNDAVNTFIDPWHQEDTDLVVICGRKLLHERNLSLINADHRPTDMLAANVIASQNSLDNLLVVRVPHFPANSLLITRLNNLSLYWQKGGRRRTIVDEAKRDRIENYESSNDAYVIEDFGAGCLIENLDWGGKFPDVKEAA